MNFLSPASLLYLLPAGGIILALYMLRLKRRDVVVPTVMFWQAAVQDTQANAPFQRLRKSLLLFLQLAAVVLFALALARPFLWASGLGGQSTALVLDASASMNATDESGSRFDAAVRQAEGMIRRKAAGDAVALVLAAEKPVLLAPLTTDTGKLLAALHRAHATDASGDMREAIQFSASLVSSRAGAQVTLLSDGDYGRLDEMTLGGANLAQVTIGKRGENVGITAFDVRDVLGGGEDRQAFVTVQNFSRSTRTVPLELRVGDALLDAHELKLSPGESKSETFDHLKAAATGTVVTAHLDVKDDLTADDTASIAVPPRRHLKILLVTEGNLFFERVLNTDSNVALDEVKPSAYKVTDSDTHDLTVFDNTTAPKNLPPGRYLFWGGTPAGPESPAASAGSGGDQPQILDWSRSHPLMRFVDLANVKLLHTAGVAPAPWGQTLAETDAGPLIVAGERGDTKAVYLGFALLESDMPLRVAFPIFLTNCVGWLTTQPGDVGGVTRPGELIALTAPKTGGAITVTRPDGGKDTVATPASGAAVALYDKADRVGVYRAEAGKDLKQSLAVSLLSPTESNTLPVEKPSFVVTDAPKQGAADANKPAEDHLRVRREVWPWVAAVVLLLIAAEWVVYHRRVG